jgi:hypothetical protein
MTDPIIQVCIAQFFASEVGDVVHHPVTNEQAVIAELMTAEMTDDVGTRSSGFFIRPSDPK